MVGEHIRNKLTVRACGVACVRVKIFVVDSGIACIGDVVAEGALHIGGACAGDAVGMAGTALVIEAGRGVRPETSGAEGHTLVEMQVDDVDGVDVRAGRAVGAIQVTGRAVHVAQPTFMLCQVLVLPVWTLH